MADRESLTEWLQKNGLILTVCNGALTACDGKCENCREDEDNG